MEDMKVDPSNSRESSSETNPKMGETKEEASRPDEPSTDSVHKWDTLEHHGPAFAPPYERLPNDVHFIYDGNDGRQEIPLSERTEEMAVAYAKVLDRKYAQEMVFRDNFFKDWTNNMSPEEKKMIRDIKKCDFTQINKHFSENPEIWNETDQARLKDNYGLYTIDGVRTEISNYNMEPPGLFLSNTPNRGKWQKRIQPEDVTINCSEDCNPEPPEGHKWKAIVHNRSVSWLAKWQHPIISNKWKYIKLSPSSKLKGEEDRKKFDMAIELGTHIERIRKKYRQEWESKDPSTQQLAIAVYLINTFAFRAGGEQDKDDADTVGCCSLRVEHLKFHDQQEVEFKFVGKASIPYNKTHKIDPVAYEGLRCLETGKSPDALIFDQLNTDYIYLKSCMEKLSIKIFRKFRASSMMEAELLRTTNKMELAEKLVIFNTANLKVAELCNHQQNLSTKTKNPTLAKDTSKEHYIDPRVVVAWCLKFDIPISEVYSKKLLEKFRWAINEGKKDFIFYRNGNSTDGNSEAGSSTG